ncbi:hypothetical protein ACWKWC_01135 [Geodermatophilus nigrescens]
MPGPEWFAVLGALLVTAGSAVQALREMSTFRRFYESVLDAHERILDEEIRVLVAKTAIWQFWRRSAIRERARREGEMLLTDEERAVRTDIDLRTLGWAVVCTGGAVTTGAALAAALA